jgi:hypothetical protein
VRAAGGALAWLDRCRRIKIAFRPNRRTDKHLVWESHMPLSGPPLEPFDLARLLTPALETKPGRIGLGLGRVPMDLA